MKEYFVSKEHIPSVLYSVVPNYYSSKKKRDYCEMENFGIQNYRTTSNTKRFDELLVRDNELQTGGRQNPCTEGLL